MTARERSDAGTFVETVGLEDVLGVFDRVDGPVITSSDVAGALDCTTEAARQKLTRLYDRGALEKRKTGRTVVYWRVDEDGPGAHARGADVRPGDGGPTDGTPEASTLSGSPSRPLSEDVDFPGGKDHAECEAAVLAARDYIQENDGATMRELVADVMPRHALGYDVPTLEPGDRFRGAWWRKIVKPGLEALDDVEKPPKGGSTWRVRGE